MKRIQCLADLEELKAKGTIPLAYLNIIEKQFFDWFEAEGTGEPIKDFTCDKKHTSAISKVSRTQTSLGTSSSFWNS